MSLNPIRHVDAGQVRVRAPQPQDTARRSAEVPARELMTDFERTQPLTVAPDRHIDAALQDMVVGGVRSLLVVEAGEFVGLVTAADLQGEKPIQFLQSPMCSSYPCKHADVQVRDVMTPLRELVALDDATLHRTTAGEILALLQLERLSHVLVMQSAGDGERSVRGVFSRTRLERSLAEPTQTNEAQVVAFRRAG